MHLQKLKKTGIIAFILIAISSCLSFDSVIQPEDALPDSLFEVEIAVRSSGGLISTSAYLGVALPEGWLVQNNKVPYTGDLQGEIIYSNSLTYQMENLEPAPQGYYWWVGQSPAGSSFEDDKYIGTMTILTDEQEGTFYLDYMIGNSNDGLNQDRSNNHRVSVIATNVEENDQDRLKIYPSNGNLVFQMAPGNEIEEVWIFDLSGKQVLHHQKLGISSISVDKIKNDIVILKARDSQNSLFQRKVYIP